MLEASELERVVDAWIAGSVVDHEVPETEPNWWAIEQVMGWEHGRDSEQLWQFILHVYRREIPDRAFFSLAAGPLECLLAYDGPAYVDRVEELAQRDTKFNRLLGGVWRLEMTEEVWNRVQAVRREVL